MRERELEDGSSCEGERGRRGLAVRERAGGWVYRRERERGGGAGCGGESGRMGVAVWESVRESG